ncbi:MAG TPA: hypothetical protein VJ772_03865 [Nitrososphaeraceae archaeon]|nr:hypothetical protein [Nitrososphaeraceae archaeon]
MKFTNNTIQKSRPFTGKSLRVTLQNCISNTGLRRVNHINPHKRKEVAVLHGFRKFFTKQLVDSKLNPEIREMLLGHKIGLASAYYKPTEQDMYQEYLKTVNLLTINEENSDNVEWYRHKDDIKLKHLSAYKYVPFDTFNSKTINNFEKMNDTRSRAWQFIMKVNSYS